VIMEDIRKSDNGYTDQVKLIITVQTKHYL